MPPLPCLPAVGGCSLHTCRECFIDRAAIQLHAHGVIPNKAFREAERLWDGRAEWLKSKEKRP